MRLHDDYGFKNIYITENGASYPDSIDEDGRVHDPYRIKFLKAHFSEAARAIQDGVLLKGYFIWSLLDNFEWSSGYMQRYGIAFTDYATRRRILKDSGYWLAEYIHGSK